MNYDVIIIGSGPGGYVSAIRCAQLGMKTAIIEKYDTLGGTCLNVGCIPSKALLDSSEHYNNAKKSFNLHGIEFDSLSFNWQKMLGRKNKVVADTCKGIDFLMKKNKIDVIRGHASLETDKSAIITGLDGKIEKINSKNIIIATGSKPANLPGVKIDKNRIISSTEALNLKEIPKKLIIIGAGAIGVEFGSVYSRLGAEVAILEYFDHVIPNMDNTLAKELLRSLKKQGIKFHLSHSVIKAETSQNSVKITAHDNKGAEKSFEGDYCLMAVGRVPYTDGLGLEQAGVKVDNKGFIQINEKLETSVKDIYAIGDVIGGAMLAHKAEEEGVMAAEIIAGQKPHINYLTIPGVVYTWPEVAAVGMTEQQLKEKNIDFKTGSFSFRALGRARAAQELDGLIKVLAHQKTDEILGIHMIGARAADMIAEAVVALEYRASAEDIARMPHAHPTFTEALKEACLDATGKRAVHM